MKDPLDRTGSRRPLARDSGGRVLIVGDRRDSRRVARRLLSQESCSGLTVVGFVDAGHAGLSTRVGGRQLAVHPQSDPVPVLGRIDRLAEWVALARATHLFVALSGRPAHRLRPQLDHLTRTDLRVHWLTEDGARPVLAADEPPPAAVPPWAWRWDRLAKRGCDFLLAAIGLMILAPFFAVVAILILISSGWPVFYTQKRVGQGGRIFRMVKFRSMRRDAEGETGPIWASDHDNRCTRIGAWLRRTNVDELPQLFNVLFGNMSLVGPRPERPVFVDCFRESVPDDDLRHAVPGGMTGWAQVHGWRGRTSLRKRLQYDLDYIHRWSFWLDFRVLFMTVQHVAWGKTSWSTPRARRRLAR